MPSLVLILSVQAIHNVRAGCVYRMYCSSVRIHLFAAGHSDCSVPQEAAVLLCPLFCSARLVYRHT